MGNGRGDGIRTDVSLNAFTIHNLGRVVGRAITSESPTMVVSLSEVSIVGRDSFARLDVVRYNVPKGQRKTCAFCGAPARFRYGYSRDEWGARTVVSDEQFCSKGCHDSYH